MDEKEKITEEQRMVDAGWPVPKSEATQKTEELSSDSSSASDEATSQEQSAPSFSSGFSGEAAPLPASSGFAQLTAPPASSGYFGESVKPADDKSSEFAAHEYFQNQMKASLPEPVRKGKEKDRYFLKKTLASCLIAILGLGTLGIGISFGSRLAAIYFIPSAEASASVLSTETPKAPTAAPISVEPGVISASAQHNVSSIVKKVSDAVVSISISVQSQSFFSQFEEDAAAGSGIIYSQDDENIYVATNNHVIEDAVQVSISVDDEKMVPAKYVGSDPQSDLAVVSVSKAEMDEAGIPYETATFGDSDLLEVGDSVVAIGNAMGEGKTATSGIISAVNKKITIDDKTLDVIQTDAAINPGNSGGALANSNGDIIGINTAKFSSTGVEGMGYSIPSNNAKAIIEDLIANGSAEKPFLGIQGMTITDQMKEMYNLPSLGVYIAEITEGGAAQAAGLRVTDIIVGYNDTKISIMEDLSSAIANTKIGEKVSVYIYRNGSIPLTVEVEIGDLNADKKF
ncbi:MAG: trypsin-like peptidase domain-containing protein [Clostridiales bacterium]|jgi:serine protease Do|nr:trypsin-like peptidase domain-containing protein [Clostridiales bacterium]